jgi:hypothetical protein
MRDRQGVTPLSLLFAHPFPEVLFLVDLDLAGHNVGDIGIAKDDVAMQIRSTRRG